MSGTIDEFRVVNPDDVPRPTAPRAEGLIDASHPAVLTRAAVCVRGEPDERSRARAIFRYVREDIALGWGLRYASPKASEVLQSGMGSGIAKTTLFVALLRAAGITARPLFVRLHSGIYHGAFRGPASYIPHSIAEVVVGGRRTLTDAYIADPLLSHHAAANLRASGLLMGWGLHCEADREWDGLADRFCQWVNNGTVPGLSPDNRPLAFRDAAHYFRHTGPGGMPGGPGRWLTQARLTAAGQRLRWLRRELSRGTPARRIPLRSIPCPGESGSVSGPSSS